MKDRMIKQFDMRPKFCIIGITIISVMIVLKSSYDLFQFLFREENSLFLLCVSLVDLLLAIGLLLRIKLLCRIFCIYAYVMLTLSVTFYTVFLFKNDSFYFFETANMIFLSIVFFWLISSIFIRRFNAIIGKIDVKGDAAG